MSEKGALLWVVECHNDLGRTPEIEPPVWRLERVAVLHQYLIYQNPPWPAHSDGRIHLSFLSDFVSCQFIHIPLIRMPFRYMDLTEESRPHSPIFAPTACTNSKISSIKSTTPARSRHKKSLRNKSNDKSLRDLTGRWSLYSASPCLPSPPPSQITITQSNYPSQIYIRSYQFTERFHPPQRPGTWSSWTQSINSSGAMERGRCRFVKGGDFEHREALTSGLERSGEVLEVEAEAEGHPERRTEVWCLENGKFVRRVVIMGSDMKSLEGSVVYDFVGA